MPGEPINRADWPTQGPHRELLELLDGLHRRSGLPSSREISKRLHVSHTRVHSLLRGKALPVDAGQVEALVAALDPSSISDDAPRRAVTLYYATKAAHADPDGSGGQAAGDEALIAASPASTPDINVPVQSSGRPAQAHALVVASVVLTLVAVVGVGVLSIPALWRLTDAQAPTDRQVLLAEEFAGTRLDPVVWNTPARPDIVGVDNDRLTFRVDPADTAAGLHTELLPRDSVPFDEVSLIVSVPEYRQAGPGGVALIVIEANGRNHRLMFSPSEGGPEVAALVCAQSACAEYDDYMPPAEYLPFEVGEQVPLRIVSTPSSIQFYARDRLIGQSTAPAGPLASLLFDVYGADSEAWTITADRLVVIGTR